MLASRLLSGRALVVVIALVLTGAASAGTIVLVKRSDDNGSSAPRAPAQQTKAHGTLHPVAQFTPDDTELASCRDQTCYEQAFANIAFKRGPKEAIRAFDRKIRSDRTVEASCHRIIHLVGAAALARYDGNVGKAFAEGSSTCWSGYYHGILTYAFSDVTSKAELGTRARAVCADEDLRRTTYIAYQCVHGLGHGLMLQTGYNLPFSLQMCDALTTAWDQTSCTGGVFMENITPSLGYRTKWLKQDDLVYPCNAVKDRHKQYCYLMVTSRILQANGYRWDEAASLCAAVERRWVQTCFQSLGRDASGFTRQSPSRVLALCRHAEAEQDECIYGAARDMTSNYANGERASQLCERAPQGIRARCFFGIGTILGGIAATPEGRRAACAALTRTNVRACLRGSGEPA